MEFSLCGDFPPLLRMVNAALIIDKLFNDLWNENVHDLFHSLFPCLRHDILRLFEVLSCRPFQFRRQVLNFLRLLC